MSTIPAQVYAQLYEKSVGENKTYDPRDLRVFLFICTVCVYHLICMHNEKYIAVYTMKRIVYTIHILSYLVQMKS